MAKLNKALQAKKNRIVSLYKDGNFDSNGTYKSQYALGREAYISRVPYSKGWPLPKQHGWKSERDSDLLLLAQCSKPSVVQSIKQRLCECLQVA